MDALFEALKRLGPARLALMGLAFVGLMIFFVFIAARSSTPSLTLLYSDLSVSDSTEIIAKLDIAKIGYRLSEDGKQISVGRENVAKARVMLAQEGLPRGASMGYEIFDQKQGFGTSSFVQNINQLRALEGELARTIMAIDSIQNARVHLVLPERELFSKETRPATASVFVSLKQNSLLSTEQIMAVRHLVSASVPQLKPTSIAIIDSNGALLARADDEAQDSLSVGNSADLKQKFENRMSSTIEDIVGRIVGYGRVRANVSADLDFNVITRNSEIFDPNGQVVRSTQTTSDEQNDGTNSADQAVTVENNLPGLGAEEGAGEAAAPKPSSLRTEEVTNFEISKTIESIVKESGDVNRLSIAVLVDGKYEPDTTTQPATETPAEGTAEPAEQKLVYVPRTQAELDQIATLVKSAVGFDASRGDTVEVINMQFAPVDIVDTSAAEGLIFGFAKEDIMGLAQTLTLSIVAILIILLVLRPLVSHVSTMATSIAQASNETANPNIDQIALITQGSAGAPQLTGPGNIDENDTMIDMGSVEGRVKASSVQKISELVTNYPNETVSVIRGWMSQENN